jgi:hypothetical protein
MRAVRLAFIGLIGGSFAYPVGAGAHEKWFVDASSSSDTCRCTA